MDSQVMEALEALKRCGQVLREEGLVWGHSGNISLRIGSAAFAISASGTDLGALRDDEFVVCDLDDEACQGEGQPSMERGLHQSIYLAQEDARAVIHSQPFFSTLVASSSTVVRSDLFPESMAYLGRIERVPYYHAGSRGLAESTGARAAESSVLLLENHGAVCWGASLEEALLKTQTLEFLCRLLVTARSCDIPLNFLGPETEAGFLRYLGRAKRA
jgi:L-fuculose-phosphate aldolase